MLSRPDLAIMLFDLSVTGVARNAVMIANAAHGAGLRTEIWMGQAAGGLRDAVHPDIQQRSLGAKLPPGYSRADRRVASEGLTNALATMYQERSPAVAFSSGNHFHDLAAAARRKLGARAELCLIGRVSNAAPNLMRSQNPLLVLLKRQSAAKRYAAMDHLVAVSREIRDELVQKLRISPTKISLIRNGVDTASIDKLSVETSPRWPWGDDAEVVLGVGRLVKQKNFDLLIDAFAIARRERPLRLAIIGSGPDGERERLVERAASLGIANDVWLPGHLPNPFPYYRGANLFVLSSRWEGMSNALLEAMACGCPVVAVRSAVGSAEILDNGRYGPLVRPEPEALERAMLTSLVDGIPAETLVARAREFDLAKSMALYVDLLTMHVARARAPRLDPAA